MVASLAGAWIETHHGRLRSARARSPPSRGRGSKHDATCRLRAMQIVASLAGAWIETMSSAGKSRRGGSPPSRGRGSKQAIIAASPAKATSPPSRGRGSKRRISSDTFAECESPPSRGRGSKLAGLVPVSSDPGRLPRGGVDRNRHLFRLRKPGGGVASLAGAWIETRLLA